MKISRVLAVIPARRGSKGLPGKNTRLFAGLPLIAHSVLFAQGCPEINRTIVSTDDPAIAEVARQYGAEVPFLRPSELARDETPLWDVLRHALSEVERHEEVSYDLLLLLDPTSPAREYEDIGGALRRLARSPTADGVIGVSRPEFNPMWHCVVEREGWMCDVAEEGKQFDRRQDAPPIYRINGSLYVWKTDFVRRETRSWRQNGKHVMYEVPELRAMSIDDEAQFQKAQLLVTGGLISFPWLKKGMVSCVP